MTTADDLEDVLREGRAKIAAARARTQEASTKIIGQEIGAGLGLVQVDISGSLTNIEFDQRHLHSVPEERLAELVVEAIALAEQKASTMREVIFGTDYLKDTDD